MELFFAEDSQDNGLDIRVLPLDGSAEPMVWLQTPTPPMTTRRWGVSSS